MNLKINGSLVAFAHSVGGGKGCSGVADVQSSITPPYKTILKKGFNVVEINVTTKDALYHTGAFYEFTLEPLACCDCNLRILNVQEKQVLEDGSKVYEVTVENNSKNCCNIQYKLTDGDWVSVPSEQLDCSGLASQNKILVTMLKDWVVCPTPTPIPPSPTPS